MRNIGTKTKFLQRKTRSTVAENIFNNSAAFNNMHKGRTAVKITAGSLTHAERSINLRDNHRYYFKLQRINIKRRDATKRDEAHPSADK